MVVGSRGMGSFKRSVMNFVGLGSVSDYIVHNLHNVVAVIKAEESQLPSPFHDTIMDSNTEESPALAEGDGKRAAFEPTAATAEAPAGVSMTDSKED